MGSIEHKNHPHGGIHDLSEMEALWTKGLRMAFPRLLQTKITARWLQKQPRTAWLNPWLCMVDWYKPMAHSTYDVMVIYRLGMWFVMAVIQPDLSPKCLLPGNLEKDWNLMEKPRCDNDNWSCDKKNLNRDKTWNNVMFIDLRHMLCWDLTLSHACMF